MGKYTAPEVTFRDIHEALPVPKTSRLRFTVVLRGDPLVTRQVFACVELCWQEAGRQGPVWQRWGRKVSVDSSKAVMGTLLLAAQEAYVWADGKDWDELTKLAAWQLDRPL